MPRPRSFVGTFEGPFRVVGEAGVHPGDHSRQYVFRCEVGHEFVARGTLVRAGLRTRCPQCKREELVADWGHPRVSLAGVRLGAFLAIEPTGLVTKNRSAIWRFVGDCGCVRLIDAHRVRQHQRGKTFPVCKEHGAKGGERAA